MIYIPSPFPNRQIHLDFHSATSITDIGDDFDANEFAATMKAARVQSVTVFAKCHHGHLYYNTPRPERHPGLKPNLDLLARQISALHDEGIRAPIYISVQCDEYAANHHPDWLARQEDGRPVGAGPLQAGWQVLDLASPYQEYLFGQTSEVLETFRPVDGVFFDMCWDQPSLSIYAIEQMLAAGLDPQSDIDRHVHARRVAWAFMDSFYRLVKGFSPDAGVFFNSRPLLNLSEEIQWQQQIEIEALPTGGWGYLYFPRHVRLARNLGRPVLGMTARFHKSWGDFGSLKPYPALEYETSQMMAQGAACSIGDQLHPRGVLDKAAYELIGQVYARVQAREPWLRGATALADVAVFQLPPLSAAGMGTGLVANNIEEGVTRMLSQLKHQFDFVAPESDWSRYRLLILPDICATDDLLVARIGEYLRAGGAVLASGTSGLSQDGRRLRLPELGIEPDGVSPYQTTYMRFGPDIDADVPAIAHVMYDRGVRVTVGKGARALGWVVEPYFDRDWQHFCGHAQTPPDRLTSYAAATLSQRAAYIAFPIFSTFAAHGYLPHRLLVRNLLHKVLPDPLLRVRGPSGLEASVLRQDSESRTIVHLLYYSPERRTKTLDLIEEIIPLHDVPVALKLETAPGRVYLAPEGATLPFTYKGGYANVTIPRLAGHAMVVFE